MQVKILEGSNFPESTTLQLINPQTSLDGMADEVHAAISEHLDAKRFFLIFGANAEVSELSAAIFHALQLRIEELREQFELDPYSLIYALALYGDQQSLPPALDEIRATYGADQLADIIDPQSGEVFAIPEWVQSPEAVRWAASQTRQLIVKGVPYTVSEIPRTPTREQDAMIATAIELREIVGAQLINPDNIHFRLIPIRTLNDAYYALHDSAVLMSRTIDNGANIDTVAQVAQSQYHELADRLLTGLEEYYKAISTIFLGNSHALINLPYWLIPSLTWDPGVPLEHIPHNPDDTPITILMKRIVASRVAELDFEENMRDFILWNQVYGVISDDSGDTMLRSRKKGQPVSEEDVTIPNLYRPLALTLMARWALGKLRTNRSQISNSKIRTATGINTATFSGQFRNFLSSPVPGSEPLTYRDLFVKMIGSDLLQEES